MLYRNFKPITFSWMFWLLGACASTTVHENQTKASAANTYDEYLPSCETDDKEYLASIRTVWDHIREGFEFSKNVDNPRVARHLAIYERRQKYFNTINERSEKYLYHIVKEVQARDIPTEIALLPIIESGLDPFAYSHGRAAGMWQFIPGTGRMFGLETSWWYEGRRDVTASTQAALNYLERLRDRFDGDWLLALAAYNSGPGTVHNAIKYNQRHGKGTDYWSLNLPKETSDYVPKLIALSQLVAEPEQYGITLSPILYAPYFDEVDAKGQIDLSQAADLAEMNTNEIYLLNPAFNRWASDPDKNRKLLVPYTQKYVFLENLDKMDQEDRLAWQRYNVRAGDSLSVIASRNRINTDFLKSVNNLRSNNIRVGQVLMIPKPIGTASSYSLTQEQRKQALSHKNYSDKHLVKYRVKNNDSLWTIGKQYNVGVMTLAKWNGMAPGDILREGQLLNIWVNNPVGTQRSVFRKVYYTVKSGDSLARIASRFNVNVNDIREWNQLHNQKYLQPGQQLVLNVNVAK